jgi:hypothetical protein
MKSWQSSLDGESGRCEIAYLHRTTQTLKKADCHPCLEWYLAKDLSVCTAEDILCPRLRDHCDRLNL